MRPLGQGATLKVAGNVAMGVLDMVRLDVGCLVLSLSLLVPPCPTRSSSPKEAPPCDFQDMQCEEGDSNPHFFRNQILSRLRRAEPE